MTDQFTIDAPSELLQAIAAAELKEPLPASVAPLVAAALAAPSWARLATASRALRVLVRMCREDRRPVPVSVRDALADVRHEMSVLRGGR